MADATAIRLVGCLVVFICIVGCRQLPNDGKYPTVQKIWTTPLHPHAGAAISFHARIINWGTETIPSGTQFRVAFAVDGQVLGAVNCTSPEVVPTGQYDVSSTDTGQDPAVEWTATQGRHFVVAAVARPSTQFSNDDIVTSSVRQEFFSAGDPVPPRGIKIMALGDSITGGSKSSTSYRYFLSKTLRQQGNTDFCFVGSLDGVTDGIDRPDTVWDSRHEGHPGWTAADIVSGSFEHRDWMRGKLSGSGGWGRVYRPDIALVDLGLNDLSRGFGPRQAAINVSKVIDTLRIANPHIGIALAEVTPEWSNEPGYDQISRFNDNLRLLALRKTSYQSPISVVDLYDAIDVHTDLVDGVHPTDAGHQKIADEFLPVLEVLIKHARSQHAQAEPDIDEPDST